MGNTCCANSSSKGPNAEANLKKLYGNGDVRTLALVIKVQSLMRGYMARKRVR